MDELTGAFSQVKASLKPKSGTMNHLTYDELHQTGYTTPVQYFWSGSHRPDQWHGGPPGDHEAARFWPSRVFAAVCFVYTLVFYIYGDFFGIHGVHPAFWLLLGAFLLILGIFLHRGNVTILARSDDSYDFIAYLNVYINRVRFHYMIFGFLIPILMFGLTAVLLRLSSSPWYISWLIFLLEYAVVHNFGTFGPA